MRGGSAAYRAVSWAFKFVMAVNRALSLPLPLPSGDGGGSVVFSALVAAAGFWSFAGRLSALALGVIPVTTRDETGQRRGDGWIDRGVTYIPGPPPAPSSVRI